ncbi:DNA-binding MarR family transcriptional regulator [Glaciihabitans tibetensis]|uniref:DNA-binding MarR family transcriptional regulator n=1 Tax=Glaciihabitans tibetensis TaxID=1266600 RepID=A0A2T0VIH6_9MICO|nr:MarR family transcriptional regulator [Glaciihabitans tibetensis]PRY69997.1 DNA-binding MarR family transcriptional regulator [Glaciihabitans tibetensis]
MEPIDPLAPLTPPEGGDHEDSIDRIRRAWSSLRPEMDTSVVGTIGRIIRASRHIVMLSDEALEQFDINRGEFDVLSALRRSAVPLTASELARSLVTSNAAITKRMVQLERSGLAVRERDDRDGRVVRLTLTPAGVDLIDVAVPAQLAFEESVAAVIAEPRREQLEETMRILLAELERRTAD